MALAPVRSSKTAPSSRSQKPMPGAQPPVRGAPSTKLAGSRSSSVRCVRRTTASTISRSHSEPRPTEERMVKMIDEIFDREYRDARAQLNLALANGLKRLGTAVSDTFAVLNRIEYSAP